MSTIFGISYWNGQSVCMQQLLAMRDCLAHWQIDRDGLWSENNIGLGHLLCYNTPESLNEKLPFTEYHFSITSDARIDNRAELASQLGFSNEECAQPDSFYILQAYQKWGDRCVEKIVGDFAWAIWDQHKQQLFCARDPFGCKPFYYYYDPHKFIFSSEIKGILSLPEVHKKPNEPWIQDLIVGGTLMTSDYTDETYYHNILRLTPGHSLTISKKGIFKKQYWDLDPNQPIHLAKESDYIETFREKLFAAVQCRLRSHRSIGAELSGGLDSSSIVATAARFNSTIKTFTQVPTAQSAFFNEAPYARQVVEHVGIQNPHFIEIETMDVPKIFQKALSLLDMPVATQYAIFNLPFFEKMHSTNIGTLLTGFGGDECVTAHGYEVWRELIANRQWELLWQEMRLDARFTQKSFSFKRYLMYIIHNKIPSITQLYQTVRYKRNPNWVKTAEIFDSSLIQQLNLPKKLQHVKSFYQKFQNIQERNHQDLLLERSWHVRNRIEYLSILLNHFKIEPRFPLLDTRLVKFYFSVPAIYKRSAGYGRLLMRKVMQELLPQNICWRTTKAGASAPAVLDIMQHYFKTQLPQNMGASKRVSEVKQLQLRLLVILELLKLARL